MESGPCLHQCRRCGVIYGCGEQRCGLAFDSGYCTVCSPVAIETIAYSLPA